MKKCIAVFLVSFFISSTASDLSDDYKGSYLEKKALYTTQRIAYAAQKQKKKTDKKMQAKKKQCIFCKLTADTNDEENLLVTRFKHFNLFLALYPYQKGHAILVPNVHVKSIEQLSVFKNVFDNDGLNIGINIGHIAGASIPDHLHIHFLPRYLSAQVSFVTAIYQTTIIQYDMMKMYHDIKVECDKFKLYREIKQLPKAELHLHLGGSYPIEY